MRKACLSLPTNRPCAATIAAVHEEAAYAAEHFEVEMHLLILDSCDQQVFSRHAKAVSELRSVQNVIVHHLGEVAQRRFLSQLIQRAQITKPDLILDLMLPGGVSYGACTNRAFLIASALGCQSIHRRDSDSRYQFMNGATLFPVHHELMSLGKRAIDAASGVSETTLDTVKAHRPVVLVGSSFVGELSVDIGDIHQHDPAVYEDVVSLWAPWQWSKEQKRKLVDDSFKGAGRDSFVSDHSIATIVDPMRVDMCNISFYQVHEDVPLPPAADTIGSDYFLMHLIHSAALPGVLHNRNIVNYYTEERRTDSGFTAYQLRLVKFFLSMLYFNGIYDRMEGLGASLLDNRDRVRVPKVLEIVKESYYLDWEENKERLEVLDRSYRKLSDRYIAFADFLVPRRKRLLEEARRDIDYFAQLIEAWQPLMQASRTVDLCSFHDGRPELN